MSTCYDVQMPEGGLVAQVVLMQKEWQINRRSRLNKQVYHYTHTIHSWSLISINALHMYLTTPCAEYGT